MQAIRLRSPASLDNLKASEVVPREPGRGEIRVRVHASSLNFHDYAVVSGMIPVEDGRIPMSDGAGEVDAVGEGVDEFAVGDRVVSCFFPHWEDGPPRAGRLGGVPGEGVDGFASESVTAPANAFTHAPEGYSHEQAATLPCAALTAWRALMVEARVKPGETVLVQGSGGVSVFALQFAKAAGCRVIATSSSEPKLERLAALGADERINYETTPAWGEAVRELTDGRGVDVIVEVGGPGNIPQSVRGIAIGGHISMIGALTGVSGELPTAELFQRNAAIQGITVGSRAQQRDMIAAIESNGIEPVISHTFKLESIADAFRLQEARGHFGKISLAF